LSFAAKDDIFGIINSGLCHGRVLNSFQDVILQYPPFYKAG